MSRGRVSPFGQLNHMLPSVLTRPRICVILIKAGERRAPRSRRDKDMSDNKAVKPIIKVLKKVTVTFLSYDL